MTAALMVTLALQVVPIDSISSQVETVTLEAQQRPIVVASKPFGESFLLAEMFAQLLESRGMAVARRLGLGATQIAFQGLRSGAIDVYPEYTGTGLVAILHEEPSGTPAEVFRHVATVFRERWGIHCC